MEYFLPSLSSSISKKSHRFQIKQQGKVKQTFLKQEISGTLWRRPSKTFKRKAAIGDLPLIL
jgi:hypothetical protein